MTATAKTARIGSISSGTLRTQDLLETCADELASFATSDADKERHKTLLDEARQALAQFDEDEDATDLEERAEALLRSDLDPDLVLDDLYSALQEYAPPYVFFGGHPGDPADIGFWPDIDAVQDAIRVEEIILSVSDLAEVPADYRGEVALVSDHGNLTLYVTDDSRTDGVRELWSVV